MQADSILPNFTETCEILLQAPGVIRQEELKLYVRLRDRFLSTRDKSAVCFLELGECLAARFENGWLVAMGAIRVFRDHTGVVVISDQIRECEVN